MLKHQLTNINFAINPVFVWPTNGVKINPTFERKITKIDNDHFSLSLSVEIGPLSENPFFIHADLLGTFELTNWEEDETSLMIAKENTTAILFPYLRHAVSDITSISNLPPYIIPVLNTAKLFKNK